MLAVPRFAHTLLGSLLLWSMSGRKVESRTFGVSQQKNAPQHYWMEKIRMLADAAQLET